MNEHGFSKEADPEDPLRFEAAMVEGEPLAMLDSLIEEYALQGWNTEQITQLFGNPFFLATNGLMQQMGKNFVEHRIEEILERFGTLHFKVILEEEKIKDCSTCNVKTP